MKLKRFSGDFCEIKCEGIFESSSLFPSAPEMIISFSFLFIYSEFKNVVIVLISYVAILFRVGEFTKSACIVYFFNVHLLFLFHLIEIL